MHENNEHSLLLWELAIIWLRVKDHSLDENVLIEEPWEIPRCYPDSGVAQDSECLKILLHQGRLGYPVGHRDYEAYAPRRRRDAEALAEFERRCIQACICPACFYPREVSADSCCILSKLRRSDLDR